MSECERENNINAINIYIYTRIYIYFVFNINRPNLTELRILLLFSDTMTRKYIFLMTGVSIRILFFLFYARLST